jgi:purine-binding chemotaxis protein CheW
MATDGRSLPPHLIFGLHGALYAVDAAAVREILPFLELSPVAELPGYILGVANLRESIVPVMDLNARLGRSPAPCRASDCIVVLDRGGSVVGIVVNEVLEVRPIQPQSVEWRDDTGGPGAGTSFVTGLARLDGQVVMLLDVEQLLRLSAGLPEAGGESSVSPSEPPSTAGGWTLSREISPEERQVLRGRAMRLAKPMARDVSVGIEPVAVTRLGDEFFGFELTGVREFATVRTVMPVPCCPPHILGLVNLRGDIVTLVDLRPMLRLVAQGGLARYMVLVEIAAQRFGVSVDEVMEIVSLNQTELDTVPAGQHGTSDYLKGALPYRGKMLGILDLAKMVADGSLTVDEQF